MQTKYFTFKEACATKETGPVYPQLQKWEVGYDDNKPDSYYSYYEASLKGSVFPDFIPDMNALIMHKKAKPTDLVSSGLSIGFIISQKLDNILKQFKLPPHRTYPTKIIHKNSKFNNYYFIHIISNYYLDYLDFVDYGKSSFFITEIGKREANLISIISKTDYIEQSKQLQDEALISKTYRSIKAQTIYFNSEFDKELDCFIAPFGIEWYISQRLKDALIENNITGCDIQPTNKLLFE